MPLINQRHYIMENIFEQFTVSVLKLNKLVHKIKSLEMREYGLKTIHVMCIYYLNSRREGLTAAELTKLTLEDKAAISRAIKTLRECGYVSYDPKRYGAVIKLTDAGADFAGVISRKAASAVKAVSYDFTDEQRIAFYKELETIADNLEKYYNSLMEGGRQ